MPQQSAQPQIFVARPPIVGHSAMSMDRSNDYIRSANPDDGIAMEGALALPSMPGVPGVPSMPGGSSPASSFASFTRSPSQYSATSVSPVLGKRTRTGCIGKGSMGTIADEFDDDEDDEDDEPQTGSPAATGLSPCPAEIPVPVRKSRKLSSESNAPCERSPMNPASCTTEPSEKPLVDWEALQVPEAIWHEAQELYEQVKTLKKVQNRQPVRKRHAILAALMFILCRRHGYPRTFAEICTAGNVTKREIGMYYNLMKQVLGNEYTSSQRASPAEFVTRWCNMLELPAWLAPAATKAYDRADKLGIVQGKCPISVSAACIWLLVWGFNHRHSLSACGFALPEDTPVSSSALPNLPALETSAGALAKDQKDVCKAAGVVIATLTSVFKLLLPKLSTLVDGLLVDHL
ncbi:hypothetical protein DL89DRAFT_9986 [Linderina pennispora]|uniref:Transcription factor TFIIB cyclin-like domain-containing protein n=1 Tax=Linderina pennispora TaxID=61395 RepID=A0A1Y1WKV7_9FUNG|nr:uncharacterized protein DL89DRAFT_9986 [Linderina pennispora]ORX74113.1 hypothetical protein DL89DRAFT_9986 [Linderina pennispora]